MTKVKCYECGNIQDIMWDTCKKCHYTSISEDGLHDIRIKGDWNNMSSFRSYKDNWKPKVILVSKKQMKDYKDNWSKELFGLAMSEAIHQGICVRCRKSISDKKMTNIDKKEFLISGLCPKCFDGELEVN
tara:strand:- start:183 stop:572 length:390 start_codon:yes stop_codon:yes gene_type:complete